MAPGMDGIWKHILGLQFTVFRGEGSQVGVAGLVKELGQEGPRELLGCEWVLQKFLSCGPLFGVLG